MDMAPLLAPFISKKKRLPFTTDPDKNLPLDKKTATQVETKTWYKASIVCAVTAVLVMVGILCVFIPGASSLVFADFIAALSSKMLFEASTTTILWLARGFLSAGAVGLLLTLCFLIMGHCDGKKTKPNQTNISVSPIPTTPPSINQPEKTLEKQQEEIKCSSILKPLFECLTDDKKMTPKEKLHINGSLHKAAKKQKENIMWLVTLHKGLIEKSSANSHEMSLVRAFRYYFNYSFSGMGSEHEYRFNDLACNFLKIPIKNDIIAWIDKKIPIKIKKTPCKIQNVKYKHKYNSLSSNEVATLFDEKKLTIVANKDVTAFTNQLTTFEKETKKEHGINEEKEKKNYFEIKDTFIGLKTQLNSDLSCINGKEFPYKNTLDILNDRGDYWGIQDDVDKLILIALYSSNENHREQVYSFLSSTSLWQTCPSGIKKYINKKIEHLLSNDPKKTIEQIINSAIANEKHSTLCKLLKERSRYFPYDNTYTDKDKRDKIKHRKKRIQKTYNRTTPSRKIKNKTEESARLFKKLLIDRSPLVEEQFFGRSAITIKYEEAQIHYEHAIIKYLGLWLNMSLNQQTAMKDEIISGRLLHIMDIANFLPEAIESFFNQDQHLYAETLIQHVIETLEIYVNDDGTPIYNKTLDILKKFISELHTDDDAKSDDEKSEINDKTIITTLNKLKQLHPSQTIITETPVIYSLLEYGPELCLQNFYWENYNTQQQGIIRLIKDLNEKQSNSTLHLTVQRMINSRRVKRFNQQSSATLAFTKEDLQDLKKIAKSTLHYLLEDNGGNMELSEKGAKWLIKSLASNIKLTPFPSSTNLPPICLCQKE